jgi:hypothetical protein
MPFEYLADLFDVVASGRIEAFTLRRHATNPRILRIRVRYRRRWDELWVDIDTLGRTDDLRSLIDSMLTKLIDQVSPG